MLRVSPMAMNSSDECPSVHTVVFLPDGEAMDLQHEPLSDTKHMEAPNMKTSDACPNNSYNNINQNVDTLNCYAPCSMEIDIEKGKEDSVSGEESPMNWQSDDYLARESCLQIMGKFTQLLMNLGSDLTKFASKDKFMGERTHDTPTHRARKVYKRYPSFNSRRVVLIFSVLSSVGTIVLIYLTLRVRQIDDGAGSV